MKFPEFDDLDERAAVLDYEAVSPSRAGARRRIVL